MSIFFAAAIGIFHPSAPNGKGADANQVDLRRLQAGFIAIGWCAGFQAPCNPSFGSRGSITMF
jgi:hypothetical protein